MINLTDLDVRYADHDARIERVNREGWLRNLSTATGASRTRRVANGVGTVRRHLGGVLVRVGVRLQGSSVAQAADSAAA